MTFMWDLGMSETRPINLDEGEERTPNLNPLVKLLYNFHTKPAMAWKFFGRQQGSDRIHCAVIGCKQTYSVATGEMLYYYF